MNQCIIQIELRGDIDETRSKGLKSALEDYLAGWRDGWNVAYEVTEFPVQPQQPVSPSTPFYTPPPIPFYTPAVPTWPEPGPVIRTMSTRETNNSQEEK